MTPEERRQLIAELKARKAALEAELSGDGPQRETSVQDDLAVLPTTGPNGERILSGPRRVQDVQADADYMRGEGANWDGLQDDRRRRKSIEAWEKRILWDTENPGENVSLNPETLTPERLRLIAEKQAERVNYEMPEKSGVWDAMASGLTSGIPGFQTATNAFAAGVETPFNEQSFGENFSDRVSATREMNRVAMRDRPVTHGGSQLASFVIPGAGAYMATEKGVKAAGKVATSPVVRGRVAASAANGNRVAQGAKYSGDVLLPVTAAVMTEAGLHAAGPQATNREALEGRDVGIVERGQMGWDMATDPITVGTGVALSPAGRALNYAATGKLTPAARVAQLEAEGIIPSSRLQKLGFTDDEIVAGADDPAALMSKARQKALGMIYKRLRKQGMEIEDVEEAIKTLAYEGDSVDEMFFELAGSSNDQLAAALGAVGGDAKQMAKARLNERSFSAPERIQRELRRAMGVEGDDFFAYTDDLERRRRTEPGPLYDESYQKAVSQDTWEKQILPVLSGRPAALEAIADAGDYAANLGELGVARELNVFANALARQEAPPQLSTQALDYIDRMLGDAAEGLRKSKGRQELARGPAQAQSAIRGDAASGLDAETGLNRGRDLSAELRTAERAAEMGLKAFANKKISLQEIEREFAREIEKYGGDEILPALLMGWVKGAENHILTSDNPGNVIRRLYGSPSQREKLLGMLPRHTDDMTAGEKGALTKRLRRFLGGEVSVGGQKVSRPGRLEREMGFNENRSRIAYGSKTGETAEAIAEQGGTQDKVNSFVDAITSIIRQPQVMAEKVARAGINRATRPGIYNPEVNRELGELMFTSGKGALNSVLEDLRRVADPQSFNDVMGRSTRMIPPRGPAGGTGSFNDEVAKAQQKPPVANGFSMTLDGKDAAGAVAGGAAGATQGDTPEEQLQNAFLGALGGGSAVKGARSIAGSPAAAQRALKPRTPEDLGTPEFYEMEIARLQSKRKTGPNAPDPLDSDIEYYEKLRVQAGGEPRPADYDPRTGSDRVAPPPPMRRYNPYADDAPSRAARTEQPEPVEAPNAPKGDYRVTQEGVRVPTSDRHLYDFDDPLNIATGESVSLDDVLDNMPGQALPANSPRIKRAGKAGERDERTKGLVVLREAPGQGSMSLQSSGQGPSAPTQYKGHQSHEVVLPKGETRSVVWQTGEVSRDAFLDQLAGHFASKGVSRVRVTIPEHTVNGVIVPERVYIVARRGDMRSPDAKFNPKMRGKSDLLAGLPLVGVGATAGGDAEAQAADGEEYRDTVSDKNDMATNFAILQRRPSDMNHAKFAQLYGEDAFWEMKAGTAGSFEDAVSQPAPPDDYARRRVMEIFGKEPQPAAN